METRTQPTSRNRRWRIAAWVVLGAVALWGAAGGLILPPIARKLIAEKLGERLGRVVVVDDVSVNPYTLDARLKGFRILEPDRTTTFAAFDQLDIEGSVASFYRLAPVIDRLTLAGLKVNLVRDGENHYNLSDIVARLQSAAKAEAARRKPQADDEPARFSVSNIRLVNAAIDFDDRPIGRKHQVSEIHLSVPFISNLPTHLKEYVQPSFAAKVNGAPLLVTGETLPFENSAATHFTLDVNALDVRRYLEYVPVPIPVRVESGTLDAHVTVRFTQVAGKQPTVAIAATAGLRDVALANEAGRLAQFARLELDLASFDPIGGNARIKSMRLEEAGALGGEWRMPHTEAADIDVDLKKKVARVASVTTLDGIVSLKRGRDGAVEMPDLGLKAGTIEQAAPEGPTWKASIGKLELSGYRVTLVDAAVKPAALHRIALTRVEVDELTTDNGFQGKAIAKLALDRGGSMDVDASFALDPLQVTAKVDARRIDLAPFRPYMTQFSTVALKSGVASARGSVTLKGKGNAMRVAYAGNAEVVEFATVDTASREDLLNFHAVRTSGIDFAWGPDAPLALTMGEIVVDRAYSRLVVNPDGKLNVQQLRTATLHEPQAPALAEPEPRPRNVRIDRITFVDSRLNFTDHFIRPNYTADVGELQGAVTGLSSDPASRATVDLKGRYDSASPVVIAGTVNPLRGDLFLDIAAKGSDIELPKLTAYSQRYAGYGIKEGRLTLDVKYHVDGGQLEGRNKILLERLTFGDKVESPDATTLPVLFAVNLLKDANGQIALELPISGSLADPQFEIGGLITQVLGGLLKKAVTSPFSLLAAAFGGGGGGGGDAKAPGAASGGDDLQFVDFVAGRADLGDAGQRKLDTLARALQGRPGLTLELAGHADAVRDLKALRYAALQKRLAGDGKAPIDDAAYAAAVRSAYAREKLPGDAQPLSVAAMETALMDKLPISAEAMRALSRERAEAVRDYLVVKGQLPPERVLLAAASGSDSPDGASGASRVDFALR